MVLELKQSAANGNPIGGILIKGSRPGQWLAEIRRMNIDISAVKGFPVPSLTANVVYGCLLVENDFSKISDRGSNQFLQLLHDKIFIPQRSELYPAIAETEWDRMFSAQYYLFHQDTGFVELANEIVWKDVINTPDEISPKITVPAKSVAIPQRISTFYIDIDPAEIAASLKDPFDKDEMAKLPFNMQKLMKGNQREADKYMKFLQENPELALKYAVPLDVLGTSRGGGAKFTFGNGSGDAKNVLWAVLAIVFLILMVAAFVSIANSGGSMFPLIFMVMIASGLYKAFGKSSGIGGGTGGSAAIDSDRFSKLQERYEKLAEEYKSQKEYHKAAHIYSKLLNNKFRAAQTLEEGGLFAEAAVIYHKQCNDVKRAAECYEKGKIYSEAATLYKEQKMFEKAADVLTILDKHVEARKLYRIVIDDYKTTGQFVKAALIYRYKLGDSMKAQSMLLEGWNSGRDAYNCLNNYLTNIEDDIELEKEIAGLYENSRSNQHELFLNAIKIEFDKRVECREFIKDVAYDIIAENLRHNPGLASNLIFFNKTDRAITRDVIKYKNKRRSRT